MAIGIFLSGTADSVNIWQYMQQKNINFISKCHNFPTSLKIWNHTQDIKHTSIIIYLWHWQHSAFMQPSTHKQDGHNRKAHEVPNIYFQKRNWKYNDKKCQQHKTFSLKKQTAQNPQSSWDLSQNISYARYISQILQ